MDRLKELEEVARPVTDWLRNNYDPHVRVVIDCYGATLLRDEMSVPYTPNEETAARDIDW